MTVRNGSNLKRNLFGKTRQRSSKLNNLNVTCVAHYYMQLGRYKPKKKTENDFFMKKKKKQKQLCSYDSTIYL